MDINWKISYIFILILIANKNVCGQLGIKLQIPIENENEIQLEKDLNTDRETIKSEAVTEITEATVESISSTATQILQMKEGNSKMKDNFISKKEIVTLESENKDSTEKSITTTQESQKTEADEVTVKDVHITKQELDELTNPCPKPCTCKKNESTEDLIVDCSGQNLTTFPMELNPNLTILNIENNNLRILPNTLSFLKKLKILNANNNSIHDFEYGSISELPDLTVLKLANNSLVHIPEDLKMNSGKLEELDLGGNKLDKALHEDFLSGLTALKKLVLPTISSDSNNICKHLKSLEIICTDSCLNKSIQCPNISQIIEGGPFDATLPGLIALMPSEDTLDSITNMSKNINSLSQKEIKDRIGLDKENNNADKMIKSDEEDVLSLRSKITKHGDINIDSQKGNDTIDSNIKIGATKSEAKTGAVDKKVICIVVAGMILIVTLITINNNWHSIKKRFCSVPRAVNERNRIANGTKAPEEMPLQGKTMV